MDPTTATFLASLAAGLGPALFSAFSKVVEKGVIDPALQRGTEPLANWLGKGYDQKKKERALSQAIQSALKEAGAPADDDELLRYLKNSGLARLQVQGNPVLQRLVARAVVERTDPQAVPPEAVRLALAWPRSRVGELGRLFSGLRQGLAAQVEWRDLITYADHAEQLGLLRQVVAYLSALEDVLVHTPAGAALRVAVADCGLSAEQAAAIEHSYRHGLQNEYRMHVVTGLKQVQKAVRLPLQEIYLELGLIPLSSEREREAEIESLLIQKDGERLRREAERVEKRVTNALAEAQQIVIVGKPGSGKTTSLKYIALMLALGAPGAARLGLGAPYLPLLVRLVDYADRLRQSPTLALEAFLKEYIETYFSSQPRQGEYLRLALERGGCLILLDGLDEVGDVGESRLHGQTLRDQVVKQVQRFAAWRCGPECANRLVVTSRLEGYRRGDLPGFAELELSPLRLPDEVEDFLQRWFTAYIQQSDDQLSLEQADRRARRDHVERLMPAIRQWDSIGRLATNPLLLTILAVIHEMGKQLPHRRVELYETVARTIIENWRAAMIYRPSRIYQTLTASKIFYLLASLACWLHANRPGGTMPEEEWRRQVQVLLDEDGLGDGAGRLVEDFLHHARQEVGLLAERAPGQIGFFHLTLEEYLAAAHIARQEIEAQLKLLAQHWADPRWEEVLLLTADELDYRGLGYAFKAYLNALLTQEPDAPEQAGRPAVLAGKALADLGPANPRNPLHQNVLRRLKEAMQDTDPLSDRPCWPGVIPVLRRAEAGDVLDELGWLPPDLSEFVEVKPAGQSPFWIGKYPVTNAQYERFLQPENFADRSLWVGLPMFDEHSRLIAGRDWGEQAWDWLQEALKAPEEAPGGVLYPRYWTEPRFGIARRGVPVVGVSWYEAGAYCRWLQRAWPAQPEAAANPARQPAELRLPTEVEWVAAAGGDQPAERYPWDAPGGPVTAAV